MSLELALDCKHYMGDRPCRFKQRCTCDNYDPMGVRVLIVKLSALGDVVRTTCLLPTIKRLYPQSHITWISRANGVRILEGHPLIDRLMSFDAEGMLILGQQKFDLVLSLDKEVSAAALCNSVHCDDKRGVCLSQWGTPVPCSLQSEHYFELGLDDDLKFFVNRHSYPQLIHDALGFPYVREPYRLYCRQETLDWAANMMQPWREVCNGVLVGLNTGSGSMFANKAPRPSFWVEITRQLIARGYGVVLLGGPHEVESNAWIQRQVGGGLYDTGCQNTEKEFVAIVDQCDIVVTGDTLALHVAVARDTSVVALFGPTCCQEIDLYDNGEKVMSPMECSPCYRRQCDLNPNCMDAIRIEEVVQRVQQVQQVGSEVLVAAH